MHAVLQYYSFKPLCMLLASSPTELTRQIVLEKHMPLQNGQEIQTIFIKIKDYGYLTKSFIVN